MRLYVIRHGETSWNVERRLQGRAGADLNENGVRLAEVTARAMKDRPFDLCFTSPLPRAAHTARIILGERKIPVIEEPRIMEISFGEWEGLRCAPPECSEIPNHGFDAFHSDPYAFVPPPGGESIMDVCERTAEFYQELIHNPEYQKLTILISTHGCASRAFLRNVYENKEDFWHGGVPMNCAVSIIDVVNGQGVLTESDKIYYDPSEGMDYFAVKGENDEHK